MPIRRRLILGLLCLLLSQAMPRTAWAHGSLTRATPAANSVVSTAPDEIRLWFTEELEPAFSGIALRDARGTPVAVPPSRVDADNPRQLVLEPGPLADGLYTVIWWNTSAVDGHQAGGSFPITIGAPTGNASTTSNATETIPLDSAIVRWANLVSLALVLGVLGFAGFVWQPAWQAAGKPTLGAERRMVALVWIGWGLIGIVTVVMLLVQTMAMARLPLQTVLQQQSWLPVVSGTRFGLFWLIRLAVWLVMLSMLVGARRAPALRWAALACGVGLTLLVSLYSHAAAVHDAWPAMLSDWLHLSLSSLWLGGLVALLAVIGPVQQAVVPAAKTLGRIVAYFSNYARIAVVGLTITGLYATWLQVGSVTGLLTTLYGRGLVVKLLLILPLLAIAGVNLVWTHRRLRAGQEVWAGRLRRLVLAELACAVAVLVAVAVMTSISPARNDIAIRDAEAAATALMPLPQPIEAMQMGDEVHVTLTISPGWVGENTFVVVLTTPAGEPVTDATLIRLRFQHQTEDYGRSELRISEPTDGLYTVSGSNLAGPGDWQVRATVALPGLFDTVVDFTPHIEAAPPPPPMPEIKVAMTPIGHTRSLLSIGSLLVVAGVVFLGRQRWRFWPGVGILATTLIALGVFLLASLR